MARLFLHGKDYGPHPFVIQLRSLETHQPLPGVELGDIGPKVRAQLRWSRAGASAQGLTR